MISSSSISSSSSLVGGSASSGASDVFGRHRSDATPASDSIDRPPMCPRSWTPNGRAWRSPGACRDRMIERLERVDPQSAADEITTEYVEMTVAEALADLRSPGAGDFFGRIDTVEAARSSAGTSAAGTSRTISHDPVVVDWRAPIAAPFYRATGADPLGVGLRRRFTLDEGEITAYFDEHLDDPGRRRRRQRHPRPGARRDRRRAHRGDARDRGDDPGRAGPRHPGADRPGARRPGRPRHRQDGGRPAPRRLPDVRAPPPPGPRRRARHRAQPGVPRLHRQRLAVARRAQRAPVHRRRPVRAEGRDHRRRRSGHGGAQGIGDDARRAGGGRAARRSTPPHRRRRRAARRPPRRVHAPPRSPSGWSGRPTR